MGKYLFIFIFVTLVWAYCSTAANPIEDGSKLLTSIAIDGFNPIILIPFGQFGAKRYFTSSVPLTWDSSRTFCQTNLEMKLLKVGSDAESDYLASVAVDTYYWTSGNEITTKDKFKWDGHNESQLDWANFYAIESYHCLVFYGAATPNTLYMRACTNSYRPICEI